jgi:hypothetical protein
MPKISVWSSSRKFIYALIAAAILAFLLLALTPAILPAKYTPGGRFTCDAPVRFAQSLNVSGSDAHRVQYVCLDGGGFRPVQPALATAIDLAVYFVPSFIVFFLLFPRRREKLPRKRH